MAESSKGAALAHAAAGRPVFPCDSRKRPLIDAWPQRATTDPEQIAAWWAQWPTAYIGMPTGRASGVVVLDVDVKGGRDGEATLAELRSRLGGTLPDTVETLTPSGGRHIWFRYPLHSEIRNSAGKLGAGLDIRGAGGYVILPGSGVNGRRYEWEGSSDPEEGAALAHLPPWLHRVLTEPERAQEAPGDAAGDGPCPIPEGKRNAVLASVAGGMRRQGLDPEAIAAALLAINAARCRPPLPEREVRRIAESIGRYDGAAAEAQPVPDQATLRPADEEVEAASLTPRCIVDQYLYADVAQLIAPGGTGKTTIILFEYACIALGWPVWGCRVVHPGWTLLVTAEDQRERLLARLREVCAAMGLTREQSRRVYDSVLLWDVTGEQRKLVSLNDGNILLSDLADQIGERFADDPPVCVTFDPLVSFGASEQAVNDNEQALITAARRIVRRLNCCCRYIHHTGQANARAGALDQYAGRGGTALPDGSRMTVVMQKWEEGSDLRPPPGCKPEPSASITVLARPKLSYAPPNLPNIWIKRAGFAFEHFVELRLTPEQAASAKAEQLERFLISQFRAGRYWTKRNLEDTARAEVSMTKAELRRAVTELEVAGRIKAMPLPPEQRQGSRTSFLCPAYCAKDAGAFGAVAEEAAA